MELISQKQVMSIRDELEASVTRFTGHQLVFSCPHTPSLLLLITLHPIPSLS